ncbi:MAG: twin-arginine translocation signal domain-containing protein, partial [Pirellulales bacterium]|nr:twin-arginine translocation signal domain-containing protein [Pirellulales bacterium]
MCENCSRRDFLGTSAVGGLLLAASQIRAEGDGAAKPIKPFPKKIRIATIFAGTPVPADRNWGVCEEEIAAMQKRLAEIEKKLGNVEFVVGRAATPQQAAALLKKAGDGAPILAINMQIGGLLRISKPLLDSARPLVVFSLPASGHDWMYPFRWQKDGKPVTMLTSSDYGELERAARLLRVIPLMNHSRVAVFTPMQGTTAACTPDKVKARMGVDLVEIPQKRFDEMLKAVDAKKAQAEAERWIKGAVEVAEPTKEDVLKAARVSLALDQLVEEEKVQSLAVGTCMGWLERGFPCLGFTRLRDRGIPAS